MIIVQIQHFPNQCTVLMSLSPVKFELFTSPVKIRNIIAQGCVFLQLPFPW
jgi:hypothetical protein